MKISLIVAADLNNGIGYNNKLLCHLPADLKYFKKLTTGHHVLMGRKTFESIGKPLPDRTNIVISNSVKSINGCEVFSGLSDAINFAKKNNETELFIIGGDSIYKQTLELADYIYLTRINEKFVADSFFPEINIQTWKLEKNDCFEPDDKNHYSYCFQVYKKITEK